VIDRIAYSPYGEATRTLRSDVNGDGFVNQSDYSGVIRPRNGATIGTAAYVVEADLDRNGVINQLDYDISIADDGKSSSGGVGEAGLFSRGVRNSVGYCGYIFNEDSGLYTVRFRTYSPTLGRWLERDPLGMKPVPRLGGAGFNPEHQYLDGMHLYQYVRSAPTKRTDFSGLKSETWVECDPVVQHDLGEYGIAHCRIIACCDKTAQCFKIEILGERPDGTVKKPDETRIPYPYSGPLHGRRYATESYGARCSVSDTEEEPCAIFNCLRRMHRYLDPPPYRPILGPNSNTYVRRTLERCDLRVKAYQQTRLDQTWGGRVYTKKWYTRKPIGAHGWGQDRLRCPCSDAPSAGLPGVSLPTPRDPARNTPVH
jgi:RHS repeat-associated protein